MLVAFILLSIHTLAEIDGLAFEKPDNYDMKLAKNDLAINNYLENLEGHSVALSDAAAQTLLELEAQADMLGKYFGTKNMYPITSSKLWEIIYNFIKENIEKFLQGNRLYFTIYMRYSFCIYVMPLLPSDYFLIFPGFYKKLLPKKLYKNAIIAEFLKILDRFFMVVKKRSKREVLPAFTFSRVTNLEEDLLMIKQIPELVQTDPIKIIRWLINFDLEGDTIRKDTETNTSKKS